MDPPVRIPKLLLDHLEQLNDKQLKRFQWFLVEHQTDGSQLIQKCHLEKADREDTVDKMVQVYNEDGALAITLDVLFRMNCCNIAGTLTEASARRQRSEGQRSSGNVSSMVSQEARCEIFSIQEDFADRHEGQPSCENVSSPFSDEEEREDFSIQEHYECSLCYQVFTDPVTLQCGHSFCKACVHNHWRKTISQKCPVCKKTSPEIEPPITFTLKSLSEFYKRRSHRNPSGGHREVPQPCQTLPKPVKEKEEVFAKIKQFCDASIAWIQIQSQEAERKIKNDFERLRLFLQEEEETRIAALRQEETRKILLMLNIEDISRHTLSLSDTVKAMEDLGADSSFMQNFKTEMERTQSTLPDPQLLPQALINVSEHVGNLQFKVGEKMMSIIKHTPVILDPNTASPWLSLSDDLTQVKVTDTWQQRPGNLECNTSYPQVLGSEGFSSGKHCWEVAVGDHPRWILGVAEETIDRKEELCSTPWNGLWTIMKSRNRYKDVWGNAFTLERRVSRIRVELDCDSGTVSFHDAENNSLIYSYEDNAFTQKLYPYFGFVEINDDAEDEEDDEFSSDFSGDYIQICESKVSLTVT